MRAGGSGREIAGKTGALWCRLPAGGFHRAEALGKAADGLLASDPSIRPVDVIAVK